MEQEANDLGVQFLYALADQKWGVGFHPSGVHLWSPVSGQVPPWPTRILVDPAMEYEFRTIILWLMVVHGLEPFEETTPEGGNPHNN